MRRSLTKVVAGAFVVARAGVLSAETVSLPNASFESPATSFVSINIDSWQKSPKPDWYVEGGGFLWSQLAGAFKNTSPASPDHIDNCHGNQAVWLFAVPEVALFQDYSSMDWNDTEPSHDFNASFEVGKSYQLTVGVIGGGGGMLEGVSLEVSLYYRDAASNQVTVAATSITNTTAIFSNTTHLIDFHVQVPVVQSGDAWAGQNIGVQFMSTVSTNLQGGYWDLDNVRLSAFPAPVLASPVPAGDQFKFMVQSEPGLRFEILATTNATLALSNWTSLGTLTNITGTTVFMDTNADLNQRYYQARQLP